MEARLLSDWTACGGPATKVYFLYEQLKGNADCEPVELTETGGHYWTESLSPISDIGITTPHRSSIAVPIPFKILKKSIKIYAT